jgi:hypothetical protein
VTILNIIAIMGALITGPLGETVRATRGFRHRFTTGDWSVSVDSNVFRDFQQTTLS